MGTDQKKRSGGPPARPSGVPKLNLNEIKGPSSQNKPTSKKDHLNAATSSTSSTYTTMATPRSQTFSPPSNRSLAAAGQSNKNIAGKTPENSKASKKTPTTTTGVSFATSAVPQRNGSGSSQSHRVDYEQPMMTPRGGSYRDVLATPRGTTRSLAEHIPNAVPTQQPVKQRHTAAPQPSSRPSSSTTTTTTATSHQEQQQRSLKQKVDRASHEQTHVKQQISTLDAAIQAQQAALVENITVVQNLGQRRDRLANDAAALQAAVARAQAASSARQAEIQDLEVLIAGLQATLQASKEEEEQETQQASEQTTATAATAVLSSKKQALMQLMQAAAGALRLPSVTIALEKEIQKQQQRQLNQQINNQQGMLTAGRVGGGGSNHQGGTSRAATARSEISTSRFVTPAATVREEGEEEDDHNEDVESLVSSSSSSEGDDSMDSSRTGIDGDEVAATATATAIAAVTATANANKERNVLVPSSSPSSGKLNRPATMSIPLLQLPSDTIPAHFQQSQSQSARLLSPNPQALARLQSIRNKLEVAEAILTARVPEHGDEGLIQN